MQIGLKSREDNSTQQTHQSPFLEMGSNTGLTHVLPELKTNKLLHTTNVSLEQKTYNLVKCSSAPVQIVLSIKPENAQSNFDILK